MSRICSATTAAGYPCAAFAVGTGGRCFSHWTPQEKAAYRAEMATYVRDKQSYRLGYQKGLSDARAELRRALGLEP